MRCNFSNISPHFWFACLFIMAAFKIIPPVLAVDTLPPLSQAPLEAAQELYQEQAQSGSEEEGQVINQTPLPSSGEIENQLVSNQPIAGLLIYKYALSAINPTPQSSRLAKDFPGNRGTNQMVIYTPRLRGKTGTNSFGTEAVIINGVVQAITCCDTEIPQDGLVLSGHGTAGLWLQKQIRVGMNFFIDQTNHTVFFQDTPAVFIGQAKQALENTLQTARQNPEIYLSNPSIETAKNCVLELEQKGSQQPSAGWTSNSLQALRQEMNKCLSLSDTAYFKALQSKPDEFRGIWVRPLEKTPQEIEQAVLGIKALHIRDLFIETYYQGKTIYPSLVMEQYGLSSQHPRFKGRDPLAEWIEIAHRHGLKVHAWTQVFFAGNVDENAEQFGPILNHYPQWTNIQRATVCSATQCNLPLNSNSKAFPRVSSVEPGHYFVDPANPEVRLFLKQLLQELVSQYPLDGVNLDYIRYPATMPIKSGQFLQSNWGYTPAARQQFIADMTQPQEKPGQSKTMSKQDPLQNDPIRLSPSSPNWPRWVSWRKEVISSFVQDTSQQLRQIRPDIKITAVTFPKSDPENQVKLQDWPRWAKEGWVDALTPIGLYPTPEGIFRDSTALKEAVHDKIPVYVGVFGAYNRLAPAEFAAQIDAVHQAGMPGIMLFEHSRLSAPYRHALQEGPFRN